MIATNEKIINNNVEDKKMELANGKLECQKCGSIVAKSSWSRHLRTAKHQGDNLIVKTSSKHAAMRANTNKIREHKITEVGLEAVRQFERIKKQKQRANIKAGIAPKSKRTPEQQALSEQPENKTDAVIDDFNQAAKEYAKIADPKERSQIADIVREARSAVASGKRSLPEAKKIIQAKVKQVQVLKNAELDKEQLIDSLDRRNMKYPGGELIERKTLTKYLNNIGRIYDRMPDNKKKKAFLISLDFDWIKNSVKQVIDFIENDLNAMAGTKRNTFNAFSSFLSRLPGYDTLAKLFQHMLIKWTKVVSEKQGENKLSDREKPNYMTWSDILKFTDPHWNEEAKLLYKLYTAMPPRRNEDYSHMKYVKGKSLGAVQEMDKQYNYMVVNDHKKPIALVFNFYKTRKVYHQQTIDLQRKVQGKHKKYFRFNEIITAINNMVKTSKPTITSGELVFPSARGGVVAQFGASWVNLVFKKTGKVIGVDILRHSFITDFLDKNPRASNNEIKIFSDSMSNSIEMFRGYRKLDVLEEEE
jgi:hypothetical protein